MTPVRLGSATYVFVLGDPLPEPSSAILDAIASLARRGATVKVVCPPGAEMDALRSAGVEVAHYQLDRFNVLRTRSRLRKYLRRHGPRIAHSSGVWANIILGQASRPLRRTTVVMSVLEQPSTGTWEDGLHRFLERREARLRASLVFAKDADVRAELLAAKVPEAALVEEPQTVSGESILARYAELLRR